VGIFEQNKNVRLTSNNRRLHETFGKLIRLRFKIQRERLLLAAVVKEFSILQSFQTGSESKPVAYPLATMGAFTGNKRQSYEAESGNSSGAKASNAWNYTTTVVPKSLY
jgi:hypothetical protein